MDRYIVAAECGRCCVGSDVTPVAGLFGSLKKAVKGVGKIANKVVPKPIRDAHKVVYDAHEIGIKTLRQATRPITQNPVWDVAATGASFVPGLGSTVSTGMLGLSALGQGLSVKDIGLRASRGLVPGGPAGAMIFDAGAAFLASGGKIDAATNAILKNQLKTPLAINVFNAGMRAAKARRLDARSLNTLVTALPQGGYAIPRLPSGSEMLTRNIAKYGARVAGDDTFVVAGVADTVREIWAKYGFRRLTDISDDCDQWSNTMMRGGCYVARPRGEPKKLLGGLFTIYGGTR